MFIISATTYETKIRTTRQQEQQKQHEMGSVPDPKILAYALICFERRQASWNVIAALEKQKQRYITGSLYPFSVDSVFLFGHLSMPSM